MHVHKEGYQPDNVYDNIFDDIYDPHTPDDANSCALANIYAGTDDHLHSNDKYEEHAQSPNPETKDDYEGDSNEEDSVSLGPLKHKAKLVTAASKTFAQTSLMHPKELIFLILVCDQWEQDATHQHAINFDATAAQAILSIQTVIGSAKMPMEKQPPPVVRLAKSGSLRILLHTEQDWEQLKTLWQNEYQKKKIAYDINIVMTKKMMKDIEEAVKVYMQNGKKMKAKAPKKKNPYLSDKSSNDSRGIGDGHDLNAGESDEYRAKLNLLTQHWPCKAHIGKICLGDKAKDIHFLALAMVQGVEGVDIKNPPHTEPFKDWYYKVAAVPRRAGARMVEDQYNMNAEGTHVTINMPPEAF
ncbi:hypothetical protein K439DRAFT_1620069 [Ramaria rubella]|nr:hypothetical protein K439DRAFT_1620069 [Ramaria rubella]